MVSRLTAALLRALLVAALVMTPTLLTASSAADAPLIAVVLAIIAAVMTFLEYFGRAPSLIEFRFAAPYNRMKYAGLLSALVLTSLVVAQPSCPEGCGLGAIGMSLGQLMDIPLSPVRLTALLLPPEADQTTADLLRMTAGIAYGVSMLLVAGFGAFVWLSHWPTGRGAFNVWTNLPLFDPTAGGDVLFRLKRDAVINIAIGLTLPFAIPVILQISYDFLDLFSITNPQTLIWTVTAWAYLPASMVMRGIALGTVARIIGKKRRRAYARAEAAAQPEQLQSA